MRRVAFLSLLIACAHASRSGDPRYWSEVQTDHFLLRTDLEPEAAAQAAIALEQVRSAILGSGWYAGGTAPGRATVVDLASSAELREFADKSINGFVADDPFGFPMMVISADRDPTEQAVLKHELTHVANDRLLVSKPRWVNEGLACYLETMRIDRKAGLMVLGEPDRNRLGFLERYPVADYFRNVVNEGREAEVMSGFGGYAFETGAWLMVHWMIDTRPKDFHAFLSRLARGESSWTAFSAVFPDLHNEQIRQGIESWLRHGMATVTLPLPEWNGEVQRRSLPAARVFALRADLLRVSQAVPGTAGHRREAIAAEAGRALASDPANPLALAILGGGDAKAAVNAHPDDWRAWVLLYDRGGRDRAAIQKAFSLAPENPSILSRMAISDQNAGKPDEALLHATRAVEFAPGRSDVLDALARIHAANHRCREAVDTEQRAIDAVADGANSGVPRAYQRALNEIQNGCTEATEADPGPEVPPRLRSCAEPPPAPEGRHRPPPLEVEFTVGEDGTVSNASVQGKASARLAFALKRYIESCTFDPATLGGKPRGTRATMSFRWK
jgi:uncharacterized protein DUF1570